MNIQVLTEAPGGYVNMDASEVIAVERWRTSDAMRMSFCNGDYVIVSGRTARDLRRLGVIQPSEFLG